MRKVLPLLTLAAGLATAAAGPVEPIPRPAAPVGGGGSAQAAVGAAASPLPLSPGAPSMPTAPPLNTPAGPTLALPAPATPVGPVFVDLVHDLKNAAMVVPGGWLRRARAKLGPGAPESLRTELDLAISVGDKAEAVSRELMDRARERTLTEEMKKVLSEDLLEYLKRLQSSHAAVLGELDALAVSRADVGKWDPAFVAGVLRESGRKTGELSAQLWSAGASRVPGDVRQTVDKVLAQVSARLRLQGVRLRTELHGTGATFGDAAGLERILLNLVLNAADAMGASPERRLTVRIRDQGTDRLVLEVEDSGPGMPPERIEKIRRGESFTTKAPGSGSGAGLPSVRAKVLEAGGTFSVDSEPGRGTRFLVELPVSRL